MSDGSATYIAGQWIAVSGRHCWVLVGITADDPLVQRCWGAVAGGGEAEDLLDVLLSGGVRSAPPFAMVALGSSGIRALARGAAFVRYHDGEDMLTVAAPPTVGWVDEPLPDTVGQVVLAGGEHSSASTTELPMGEGVTLASSIVLRIGAAATSVGSAPLIVEPRDVLPAATPMHPKPSPVMPPSQAPETAQKAIAAGTVDSVTAAEPDQDASIDTASTAPELDDASYDQAWRTARPPSPAVVAEILDSLESPAVSVGDEPPDQTMSWYTGVRAVDPTGVAGPRDTSVPPTTVVPVVSGGRAPVELIDDVPWATGSAVVASPVPAPSPVGVVTPPAATAPAEKPHVVPMGTEPELTISRAALRLSSPPTPPLGPTVLAVTCPAGHLTAAHSAHCRVCGAAVASQNPVEVARPALGVLRLPDGPPVRLDHTTLIGRAPSVSEDADEHPNLIRVQSPGCDVSRNHLAIVLKDWQVYAKDLNSVNGTTVTLPGQSAVRLRPGELQPLEHGTVVVLADEVSCTFEVTA